MKQALYVEGPKNLGTLSPTPWDRGVADPVETHCSLRVTIPNLVILGIKWFEHTYGDLPGKCASRVTPLKVTQSHWN